MLKSIACAALLAGALSGAALAAEPQPQPTGPILLGDEQLDRVAAGISFSGPLGLAANSFYAAHNILASNSGGLPDAAQTAIGLLHEAIFLLSN